MITMIYKKYIHILSYHVYMVEITHLKIDSSQNAFHNIQNPILYHITYPVPSEAQRNRNEHIVIEYSNRWRLEYFCSMFIMTIGVIGIIILGLYYYWN